MISFMTKMTDRPVVAACFLGASFRGTGLSGGLPTTVLSIRERGGERPTQAPAAAVVAEAQAYAIAATNGAGNQKQQHLKWAFRGLEPWSDPA
ncbi:hypothetical protein [Actinacidiphila sp. bgisy167]|uniref:hypothetical protein n=1 Tax=Actinacidiphila sp. bgisy167 TaxID=3413797 RepID=UPI003D762369